MTDPLVVGIGNPDRGDDAAGMLVARALTTTRVKELPDCTSLLDVWESENVVVVVDAMRSGREPGSVTRYDALREVLPVKSFSSTHSFGLAETVELARALNRLPGRLVIFGIEAGIFDHGHRVSAAVKDAIADVVATIEAGEI